MSPRARRGCHGDRGGHAEAVTATIAAARAVPGAAGVARAARRPGPAMVMAEPGWRGRAQSPASPDSDDFSLAGAGACSPHPPTGRQLEGLRRSTGTGMSELEGHGGPTRTGRGRGPGRGVRPASGRVKSAGSVAVTVPATAPQTYQRSGYHYCPVEVNLVVKPTPADLSQ